MEMGKDMEALLYRYLRGMETVMRKMQQSSQANCLCQTGLTSSVMPL